MIDAGFIDIKVRKIKIDVGHWRGGKPHNLANIDKKHVGARRAALSVFSGAFGALINHMKEQYPDEGERQKFTERVQADLANPEYRLYTISYTSHIC